MKPLRLDRARSLSKLKNRKHDQGQIRFTLAISAQNAARAGGVAEAWSSGQWIEVDLIMSDAGLRQCETENIERSTSRLRLIPKGLPLLFGSADVLSQSALALGFRSTMRTPYEGVPTEKH